MKSQFIKYITVYLLGNMSVCTKILENPSKIFHLKPQMSNSWHQSKSRAITKVSRRLSSSEDCECRYLH